jgi:hypothetical protein
VIPFVGGPTANFESERSSSKGQPSRVHYLSSQMARDFEVEKATNYLLVSQPCNGIDNRQARWAEACASQRQIWTPHVAVAFENA